MNNILVAALIIGGAIVAALIFEESRDWLIDTFEYIISFEWFGDAWEMMTGVFEDIGELSYWGLIMGFASFALIYILRKQVLYSFTQYMGDAEKIFWIVTTYVMSFVFGYFIGKGFLD